MQTGYVGRFQSFNFQYCHFTSNTFAPALFQVLRGEIPGDILVALSAEELASDDRRQTNDKIRDHMKAECERGQASLASTDMFK